MKQRDIAFGKSSPGPFVDIINLFVEEGLRKVETETISERRQGILEGLGICTAMRDGEVLDFELALVTMRKINHNNKDDFQAREVSYEEYKRHEMATLEVAVCYDVLRGAHKEHYGEFYGGELARALFLQDGYHDPEAIGDFTKERYDSFVAKLALRDE